ncbi:hypothetical protein MRX96_045917 [Rhipicephalus microplus]
MDHHGAALAEPRPCGHWKASPVSPPVRVLYRAPLKRAIQVRWGDPNSGPFPAGARASRRRKTPEGRLHPGWSRLPRLGGCGREAMRSARRVGTLVSFPVNRRVVMVTAKPRVAYWSLESKETDDAAARTLLTGHRLIHSKLRNPVFT